MTFCSFKRFWKVWIKQGFSKWQVKGTPGHSVLLIEGNRAALCSG